MNITENKLSESEIEFLIELGDMSKINQSPLLVLRAKNLRIMYGMRFLAKLFLKN